jgi:ABC-2 type transport system ATP-binding protein
MIRRLRAELDLTILLSSHLLVEVEQICTQIAVLQSGRLVFSGTVTEATRHQGWVRLRTDDFDQAAALLRQQGLVEEHRQGDSIRLADGVGIEAVVRALVNGGRPVFAITPLEQTLEDFYLAIMERGDARAGSGGPPA